MIIPHTNWSIRKDENGGLTVEVVGPIDKSYLSEYARELLEELVRAHPSWLAFASNGHPEIEDQLIGLTMKIPCPSPGHEPILIHCVDNAGSTIVWYYGGHVHMDYALCRYSERGRKTGYSAPEMAAGVLKLVDMIMEEQLISAAWSKSWFGPALGLLTPDEWMKYRDRGHLTNSVSWKGTFNYNYDATRRRLRDGIIEYLELVSSGDQREYQARGTYGSVGNELIAQWEDVVHINNPSGRFCEPAFTTSEQEAILRFHATWDSVAKRLSPEEQSFEDFICTPEWNELQRSASEALSRFQVRGKLPED